MWHMTETKFDYIIFGVWCVIALTILIGCRKFIFRALSEGDAPSSKRVGGFMLVTVICFNETFTTLKTREFKYDHLLVILVAIMLCWGIATMPQILEAWKGKQPLQPLGDDNDAATKTEVKSATTVTVKKEGE
jgi:hypothetical protein